jgi:hypothetical protein
VAVGAIYIITNKEDNMNWLWGFIIAMMLIIMVEGIHDRIDFLVKQNFYIMDQIKVIQSD